MKPLKTHVHGLGRVVVSALLLSLAATTWPVRGFAAQQVGLEVGPSVEIDSSYYKNAEFLRLNYNHTLGDELELAPGLAIQPRWEVSLSHVTMDGELLEAGAGYWEVAARLLVDVPLVQSRRVFFQAGTGPAYLNTDKLGPKRLGSRLNFRTHFGLGFRLGPRRRYDIILAFSHISNAGIRHHNPGENFGTVKVDASF